MTASLDLRRRAAPGARPRWTRREVTFSDACTDQGRSVLKAWAVEHLSGDMPYGAVCLIAGRDGTLSVQGRAYADDGVARSQGTRRHKRLNREDVDCVALLLRAEAGFDELWCHLTFEQRVACGTSSSGVTFRRDELPRGRQWPKYRIWS